MDYLKINKEAWDKRTGVHLSSSFYDVKGFESGNTSLREIELVELQDVNKKTLLHLQCHFGLDTLSWARQGAIVTGVDLSSESIAQAKNLSKKLNIKSTFICSDVYAYGANTHQEKFDIVFTSYGAILWLPCLDKWAKTVANCLKPNGLFYMVEFHPFYNFLEGESYFYVSEPSVSEEGTYTDSGNNVLSKMATWSHPLSSVVNALISAGMAINYVHEFPFSPYNCFEGLEEKEPGRFFKTHGKYNIPLVYSLSATKHP